MDRGYTKLKNAFKLEQQIKGARAIMIVNTVNYYNRDNWTEQLWDMRRMRNY